MGQDKSLLQLAGRPLIAHAVRKLHQLSDDVAILSVNSALAAYAPLVPDLHPDCGPISGIEAALLASHHDWSLILPVDVPFVPVSLLRDWTARTFTNPQARLALFLVDGRPQPALLLLHRLLAPALTAAIGAGRYKLYPELAAAALGLGAHTIVETEASAPYFTNLNTPEDFASAERLLHLLPD